MKIKNLIIFAVIAYLIYRYRQYNGSPAAKAAAAAGKCPLCGFVGNLGGISFPASSPLTATEVINPDKPTKPPILEDTPKPPDTISEANNPDFRAESAPPPASEKAPFSIVYAKTPFVRR